MAYPTDYKSAAIAADLASTLAVRISTLATPLAIVQSFSSDLFPSLTVGTGVAGTAGCFIHVRSVVWPLATDVLGNAAAMFTPHTIQLCFEAEAAAQASWINPVAVREAFIQECLSRGCRLELYHSNNGTAPTFATITGTPDAVIEPDLQYPMTSDM